jgi:hypothetical protein
MKKLVLASTFTLLYVAGSAFAVGSNPAYNPLRFINKSDHVLTLDVGKSQHGTLQLNCGQKTQLAPKETVYCEVFFNTVSASATDEVTLTFSDGLEGTSVAPSSCHYNLDFQLKPGSATAVTISGVNSAGGSISCEYWKSDGYYTVRGV